MGDKEEDENSISHLKYEGGKWLAKFISDKEEWYIDLISLDVIFMQDCIDYGRKKPGMLVEVPKGRALLSTSNQFAYNPSLAIGYS